MDFKYTLVGETKRYAKFEPNPGQGVTGAFYLEKAQWAEHVKPTEIILSVTITA